MYNVIICEDCDEQLKLLTKLVSDSKHAEKLRAVPLGNAKDLMKVLDSGLKIDIFISDIELGEENGIDVAKELLDTDPMIQVVFVTGYEKYHTKVYETQHVYFLTKPIKPVEFEKALEKAIQRRDEAQNQFLSFTDNVGVHRILMQKILYCESEKRKVKIIAENQIYEFYTKLSVIEDLLSGDFVRCHQSFLVNMSKVAGMKENHFILHNGERVPISQTMQKKTRERFFNYIGHV